ncbi:hypothetical protein SAMN04488543_3562 [Friedmanniella luteola]|uniref:ABC-2 family transporter protein n=1 Tax=Friedmanniella luteola TaxID=546871 RepID=A0A1H1Z3Y9_9ACTN|nr:hypothetical protein [Friedmanniella luteola]SDT28370.1 hypothetical protein SAMN04488543_3562 [Friedmanniella luteola]
MTATTSTTSTTGVPAAQDRRSTPTGVPFGRLLVVETRKLVDTRAGRGLLLVIALVTAATVALVLLTSDADTLTWSSLALASALPQAFLLPVLGILTATAEWIHRTGLVTFTLEPRRLRVGVAKLVAASLVGLAAVGVALVVGALANVVGIIWLDGDGSWSLDAGEVGGAVLLQLVGVAQGVGFGAAIGASAPAIVAFLVLPTLWTVLGAMVGWLETPARWLDLAVTSTPLLEGSMAGVDWARLATSVALWVLLPLAVGTHRLLHREVS